MQKMIVGCGYLGLRVAAAWIAAGHQVAALTRSATRAKDLADLGIKPVIGDICQPESLKALPAAETVLFAVGYDKSSGYSQQAVYVDGLKHVLDVVAARTRRLIYISSSSVYGQSAGEWVDESSECQPMQPGGQCCLAAEQLVRAYFPDSNSHERRDCSANVLRFSGIYGPGRLLSRVESLRAGEPLTGRGDAWLNLIHVDDGVRAVLATELLGEPGQTYLVSDNLPIHRADYYGRLAVLCGAPPPRFNPSVAATRGSGGINKRCRNQRMTDVLKVDLQYPTVNEGLPQAIG